MHVPVVVFESCRDVAELLGDYLDRGGIAHASYCVPVINGAVPDGYPEKRLQNHRPRLVLTSWRYGVGPSVILAIRELRLRPHPEIWVSSGFDDEELLELGAMFRVDRIFHKPLDLGLLAEEVGKFLEAEKILATGG